MQISVILQLLACFETLNQLLSFSGPQYNKHRMRPWERRDVKTGEDKQKQPGQAGALTFALLEKTTALAFQVGEGCGIINGSITGQRRRSDWFFCVL